MRQVYSDRFVFELLQNARDLLARHGITVAPPSRDEPAAAFRARLATALGVSVDEIATRGREGMSGEEQRAQRAVEFSRRKAALRALLIALSTERFDVRSARIRQLDEEYRHAVTCPDHDPLDSAFEHWLATRTGLTPPEIHAVVSLGLEAGNRVEDLGERLRRSDLPVTLGLVRRILDEARLRRADRARNAFQTYRGVALAHVARPAGDESGPNEGLKQEGRGSGPEQDDPSSSRTVRAGAHREDDRERRLMGELGARGEDVAFAWAATPLVDLYESDRSRFAEVVHLLRERLTAWDLEPALRDQFDAAKAALGEPGLATDELLEHLADLIYLSGERASDGFGFDLLAYRPDPEAGDRVLTVEVKTGRRAEDPFHLSEWQYRTACWQGAGYAILRVAILPHGRDPELRLLLDPVRLADCGELVLEPEAYRGRLLP
jgi:hypothetical protein